MFSKESCFSKPQLFKQQHCNYHVSSVKLEPLRQESEEAEMILKYMYRSRGAADHRVWAIFRLGDASTPELAAATHNRKLLWHGTKRANLLRKAIIVSRKLLVNN